MIEPKKFICATTDDLYWQDENNRWWLKTGKTWTAVEEAQVDEHINDPENGVGIMVFGRRS